MKKSLLLLSSTVLLMSNLFGTVYSDGTNPEDWKLYTTTQGEVGEDNGAIEFKGNGKQGFYLPLNIKCDTDKNEYELSWKMKSKRYSQTLIQIMTKDGIRYLSYYPTKNTHGKNGRFLKFGLDNKYKHIAPVRRTRDGKWHTNTQNIVRDLKRYEPDNELLEIKAMLVRGTVLIDDVEVLTHTFTDRDRFIRAMRSTQPGFSGDAIEYFPELGIGSSTVNMLAYEVSNFFAFSDDKKDSLTRIDIYGFSSLSKYNSEGVRVFPDNSNKKLTLSYNCKDDENHIPKCLKINERYHDIYDVSNPLNPVLISTKIEK